MFNRTFKLFAWIYGLIPALVIIITLAGCTSNENRRGFRNSKYNNTFIAQAGRADTNTADDPTIRLAYVLEWMSAGDLLQRNAVVQATGRTGSRTRSAISQNTANYAMTTPGSGRFGFVKAIAVVDSSTISSNYDSLSYSPYQVNDSSGVTGFNTTEHQTAEGVTDESVIDILPDGSSLLVSAPDASAVYQFHLDVTGRIIGRDKIDLVGLFGSGVRPTRFTPSPTFSQDRYVFVATNVGIATLCFAGTGTGRVVGSTQAGDLDSYRTGMGSNTRVYDIAISTDNQVAYIINNRNEVLYRDLTDVIGQIPSGNERPLGYQAYKLAIAPVTVTTEGFKNSVAVLTSGGMHFLNWELGSNRPEYFYWNDIGILGQPKDIAFHPDGKAVLVLTPEHISRIPLDSRLFSHNGYLGPKPQQVYVGGANAKAMAIDKAFKHFVAVAIDHGVAFCRLDPNGIVSPPGASDITPVESETISITVR